MTSLQSHVRPSGKARVLGASCHSRPLAPTAVSLAVLAGSVYLLVAGGFRFRFGQTEFAHHVLMADAMLHGQLHIRQELLQTRMDLERPAAERYLEEQLAAKGLTATPAEKEQWIRARLLHDWAIFDGRVYGYWAPLAAVVMMPWVALFGAGASDLLVNALVGGLNVGLFYWLLHRLDRIGLFQMTQTCAVALTVLLAFGTVHFYLACAGRVWFAAQIFTLTVLLAACIAAFSPRHRPHSNLLTGLFFGAALLGRNIVGLAGLFFPAVIWLRLRAAGQKGLWPLVVRTALFCLPCVLALGVQAAYNEARFGDVFESGLAVQIRTGGDPQFIAHYERYGQFDARFVAKNIKYYLWNWRLPRTDDGRIWFDPHGNSMFLVTPPLLYMFLAWRTRSPFVLALICGAAPVVAALLAFQATGFRQFGNRYLLDVMPFLLLLVAAGMRGRLTYAGYALIVLAVAANLFGTYRFCYARFEPVHAFVSELTLVAFVALALVAGAVGPRMVSVLKRAGAGGRRPDDG